MTRYKLVFRNVFIHSRGETIALACSARRHPQRLQVRSRRRLPRQMMQHQTVQLNPLSSRNTLNAGPGWGGSLVGGEGAPFQESGSAGAGTQQTLGIPGKTGVVGAPAEGAAMVRLERGILGPLFGSQAAAKDKREEKGLKGLPTVLAIDEGAALGGPLDATEGVGATAPTLPQEVEDKGPSQGGTRLLSQVAGGRGPPPMELKPRKRAWGPSHGLRVQGEPHIHPCSSHPGPPTRWAC